MKTYKKIAFLVLMSFFVMACGKDEETLVIPIPETPVERVKQILKSPTDIQSFEYNEMGKVSRYISQWQFVQNDPASVKKIIYDFVYDTNGSLSQVKFGNSKINYYYQNNLLYKTEETDGKSEILNERIYTYENNRLHEEYTNVKNLRTGLYDTFIRIFKYDAKGNLIKEEEFYKEAGKQAFIPSGRTEYDAFDDKANPDVMTFRFPFLPMIEFFKNNPGKTTHYLSNGNVLNELSFTYVYNDKNYPVKKIQKFIQDNLMTESIATFDYY